MIHSLICNSSVPLGELPPPPPPCFGRDDLIKEIVSLAKNLTPIALIGAGGIGKTSIALALLHNDQIKEQFGKNRWFIRCDKFPSTLPHFLRHLSHVIGAGVENPEDLAPLRPFLSSREMLIVLDNTESVLDPKGVNGQEIYKVVEELGLFETICLCITSRITTIPKLCKKPIIPTLSTEAACDIFYSIYDDRSQPDVITNLLEQLGFHALSITLLATTASQNGWNHNRLVKEWNKHHTQVLQTDHNESLAATIELSLTSPMFCELGSNAPDLLGVIAFFPQGVDENNLDWLFPTISNRQTIVDKFCALSLTYRSNDFITMLAPLRDYLYPKDPKSSPLLCVTKGCYFSRLSVVVDPQQPGFEEAKWIMSEDVNVEHLLDVFTSTDADSDDVWDACASFMEHLYWQKPHLVMLGPKVKGLPDDHTSKPECLFQLSRLFHEVGNHVEEKQHLLDALELWRGWGDKFLVARVLKLLARANMFLDIYTEGIELAKESLGIFEQLNNIPHQADSLQELAELLCQDGQLDAAEEAASKSINLLLDQGEQFKLCKGYRLLGKICSSKGEMEKATDHLKTALGIASPSNWDSECFWILLSLAEVYFDKGRFDDSHAHIEQAKLHAVNSPYQLCRAMEQQAYFWYKEGRIGEAKSEVLCAIGGYEKLGAAKDVEGCMGLLQKIEMKQLAVSGDPDPIGAPGNNSTSYSC